VWRSHDHVRVSNHENRAARHHEAPGNLCAIPAFTLDGADDPT
jgi:hypothetical protein